MDTESQLVRGMASGVGRANYAFTAAVLGLLFSACALCAEAPESALATPAAAEPGTTADQKKLAFLLDEEVRLAEKLIEAFPNSEEPLVVMGRVYSRHGDTDRAVEYWTKAVEMNPRRIDVYNQMAQVAAQMDEYERAISLWNKILQVDPNASGIRNQIADAYMNLGQYDRTIETVREELKVSGDNAESYFRLGQAYQHAQRYEEAKQNYERVLALQPGHREAYYGAYLACARLKLTDEAKRYLARFKELKAEHKDAVREYDEALPSDLDCAYQSLAKLWFDTRTLHVYTGQTKPTEDILRAVMKLGGDSVVFLKRLAELYVSIQRAPEALTLYRRAVQIAPGDKRCHLNIGLLAVQMGMFGEAEKAFQRIITLAPDEGVGYQELSRLYLRTKTNLPEARRLAQKAVDLEANAGTYYDLGLACYANGDADSGLAALKRAAELEPENSRYTQAYQMFEKRGRAQ
jgi:tetratricopeptide (TPR) repeat protein